jgi:16S rRNA (cytosine967-C5)-methyltransferase
MSADGIARERAVALRVLRRVDGGAYADRALAAEARRADLDPRARAHATRLAYGAVQRRRTLDWLIDGALDRPAALEPALRDILRLGAYEVAFSDGVPDHAAVDQAVRQARALRGPTARASARAGVVNAVMRRIAAEAGPRLAGLEAGGASGAALRHSMPDWIADRLVAALGEEDALGVMAAAAEPAESALRWNPLRGPREELEAELPEGWRRDPAIPEAYVVPGAFDLEGSSAWERGLAMGQSRASQLVARAVDPRPGERILDLCAAPGAKTSHLAALADGGARITAVELRPARAATLRSLLARMGA